jgi:CHAT domain-containing protein/tetratricopeptide (TPR) repeat protein
VTKPLRWSVFVISTMASGLCAAQPVDPLVGVEDLILSGQHAQAQEAARNAQSAFSRRGDRVHEALSLLVLAAAKLSTRDFAGAAADVERSAAALEKQGDRFSFWLALWHLGVLERAQRRPAEAMDHLRRALGLVHEIEASSEPFSAEGLKYLGRYLQMPPDLLRALPTQPEAVKPILLRIAEAMTRRGTLDVLLDTGRLDAAEAELARLVELSQQLDGMFGEEARLYRGTLRRLQWRLDEAREIFRQALAKPGLSPGREMEVLASLVELEFASGRLDDALVLIDRALALARRVQDRSQEARLLMFRSQILRNRRQFGSAEDSLAQAMGVAQESEKTYEQALVFQQRAHLALDEGRPEEAAGHFENAARLFHEVNRPEHEAHAWIQLSLIYARLQSRARAAEALEKAREIARKSGSPMLQSMTELLAAMARIDRGTGTMAELKESLMGLLVLPQTQEIKPPEERRKLTELIADVFQVLAGAGTRAEDAMPGQDENGFADLLGVPRLIRGFEHYQRGEFESARRLWLAALDERPRREIEITLLAFIGFSYGQERKDDEALRYLIRAVAVAEQDADDLRLEELLAGYWGSEKQVLFAELIDLLVRNGRTDEAFEYAERARARAFLQGLGNPRLAAGEGADEKLVREAEELRRQILDRQRQMISAPADEQEQRSAELLQARERYQSLLVRLKLAGRDRRAPVQVEPQRMAAIREQLGRETSLVNYFVSASQVHAWVIDREVIHHVTLPLAPEDLGRAVCWADQIGHRSGDRGVERLRSACGGKITTGEEIYQKLIHPLRRFIRHRRLIVVPHGELHYLPFAALRDPKTGRYLIEDYTLTYAPSASVLGFLRARETPVEARALVLGAPEELDPKLRPLPAARQEAEAVGRLLDIRPLFGAQAKEAQLYKLAGRIDLLHVAAHGFYEPRSPLFSRIALAPDQEHDGNLEVHEILSALDLTGVNLVVLSACETARGERSRGDEITGLTRAFLSAGSPGVISTLWNIDDEAAVVLMEEFYHHLLAGASAAEALLHAQLALLRNPVYSDPGFWAAFSLVGDPQGKWTRPDRRKK